MIFLPGLPPEDDGTLLRSTTDSDTQSPKTVGTDDGALPEPVAGSEIGTGSEAVFSLGIPAAVYEETHAWP